MTTIREIMQSEPITVQPEHPLQLALELLIEYGISTHQKPCEHTPWCTHLRHVAC